MRLVVADRHAVLRLLSYSVSWLQAAMLQAVIRDQLQRLAPQKRKLQQELLVERSLCHEVGA